MIVEGGRIKYAWGLQFLAIVFVWLIGFTEDILLPKGEARCIKPILLVFAVLFCLPAFSQDCDVDFPGSSILDFSTTCGGGAVS